jgi:hypothetical protein
MFVVAAVALTLAGCSAAQKVADFVGTVTAPITNPVRDVDIYRVKNTYAATLAIAVNYREYCWSKPYAALMADPAAKPICQRRRDVIRGIQAAQLKASAAIRRAEAFARANPTTTATALVQEAWAAVQDFQRAVPSAP